MTEPNCLCDEDIGGGARVRVLELRHETTSELVGLSFILTGADPNEVHYTTTELEVQGEIFRWDFEWPDGAYQITVKPPPLLVKIDEDLRVQRAVDREFQGMAVRLYADTKMMRKVSKALLRAEAGKKV